MESAILNSFELVLRPIKMGGFDKGRDFRKVNTWQCRLVQFFTLIKSNCNITLGERDMVTFTALPLRDSAAVWWYTLQLSDSLLGTCEEFEKVLQEELTLNDHVQAARDLLKNCQQALSSVDIFVPFVKWCYWCLTTQLKKSRISLWKDSNKL